METVTQQGNSDTYDADSTRERISGEGFRRFSGMGMGSLARLLSLRVDAGLSSMASRK